MIGLNIDIKNKDIYEWEEKLGKPYSSWSETEKITFLASMAGKELSVLDAYVSDLQLGSLSQTPFGEKILQLQELGFKTVMINDFKYVGMADSFGKEAKEIILFHSSGLLYYATSTQEGLSFNKSTDIKRSELYFQAYALKEGASKEAFELLSKGSGIHYSDGTFFRGYNGIQNKDIKILLDNCEFVEKWNSNATISLLNESDVYQQVKGKIIEVSDTEETLKQMDKINQFPEEVKVYLGYSKQKKR